MSTGQWAKGSHTVQLEEFAGNGEPEARAAAALQLPTAHLRESLALVEHVKLVGRQPHARVMNFKHDRCAGDSRIRAGVSS